MVVWHLLCIYIIQSDWKLYFTAIQLISKVKMSDWIEIKNFMHEKYPRLYVNTLINWKAFYQSLPYGMIFLPIFWFMFVDRSVRSPCYMSCVHKLIETITIGIVCISDNYLKTIDSVQCCFWWYITNRR